MALTRMQMDPLFEQSCFVWKFFALSTCLAAGQVFKNTPYLAVKIFTEVPLKFFSSLLRLLDILLEVLSDFKTYLGILVCVP